MQDQDQLILEDQSQSSKSPSVDPQPVKASQISSAAANDSEARLDRNSNASSAKLAGDNSRVSAEEIPNNQGPADIESKAPNANDAQHVQERVNSESSSSSSSSSSSLSGSSSASSIDHNPKLLKNQRNSSQEKSSSSKILPKKRKAPRGSQSSVRNDAGNEDDGDFVTRPSKCSNKAPPERSKGLTRSSTLSLKKNYSVIHHEYSIDPMRGKSIQFKLRYHGTQQVVMVDYFYLAQKFSDDVLGPIHDYIKLNGIKIDQPKIVKARGNCAGASKTATDVAQLQQSFSETDFGTGWYYSKRYQREEFQPSRLEFSRMWFEGAKPQQYMDCVIHAINYAVGYRCYTSREQVIRLMRRRMHSTYKEALTFKQFNGVSLKQMNDVVADSNNNLYSPAKIYEWEYSQQNPYCRDLLNQLQQSSSRVFIMNYRDQAVGVTFTHAVTLKKCSQGTALFDSARSAILYSRIEKCAQYWNIEEFLKSVYAVQLWVLVADSYSPEEKQKQLTLLQSLMTGDKISTKGKIVNTKRNKKAKTRHMTMRKKHRAKKPLESAEDDP